MKYTELLHPMVSSWFTGKFGGPTPVQAEAIPLIHKNENVLITSPTGTGKTLAAFLGIIDDLLAKPREEGIFCVYISPLRALNRDIEKNLSTPLEEIYELAKQAGEDLPRISIGIRTSDTTQYQKTKMLKKPPDILITTPESFAIALSTEKFSRHLKNVKYVVIDEIHEICSSKRGSELSISLERLQRVNRTELIRIGISATIAPVDEISAYLGGHSNGKKRPVSTVNVPLQKDTDLDVLMPVEDLLTADVQDVWQGTLGTVRELISGHKTTIVFTNTRRLTEKMVADLSQMGVKGVQAHHGSLSRDLRLEVEASLRSGELRAVVCSTSLELGIDIGTVDLVVQVGSPRSIYRLVQRIGRAGHSLKAVCKGRIIPQTSLDLLECCAMARALKGGRLDSVAIPRNSLDVLAQGILALSLQAPLTVAEAYETIKRAHPFSKLTKKDFKTALNFLSGKKGCPPGTYAKVHYDPATDVIAPRKGSRYIYFLNSGTIPPEVSYRVVDRTDGSFIGSLPQDFGQMLKVWDVFLLSARALQVVSFKGQTVNVRPAPAKRPTIPRWHSEIPSRTKELSDEIKELLAVGGRDPDALEDSIGEQCGITLPAAASLSRLLRLQSGSEGRFPGGPHLLIEGYVDPKGVKGLIFHTFATRRINSTLGRILGARISGDTGLGVQAVVSDDHLLLTFSKVIPFKKVLEDIPTRDLESAVKATLSGSEMFRQNFRLNAQRSLMLLKRRGSGSPKNHYRLALRILGNLSQKEMEENLAVRETYRDALERLLDIKGTRELLASVRSGKIVPRIRNYSQEPTPLAWEVLSTGVWDTFAEGGGRRRTLALAGGSLEAEFTPRQLGKHFPKEPPGPGVEGLLHSKGPLTYSELMDMAGGDEEDTAGELYTSIESGRTVTGYFKPSNQKVQYMLRKDLRTIKLREAGRKDAVLDAAEATSAMLGSGLDLERLGIIRTRLPFTARGRTAELDEMLRRGEAFSFRTIDGQDAFVHKDVLSIATSALRTREPDQRGRLVLGQISANGDSVNALMKRTGLGKNEFFETLNILMEDLHILGGLGGTPGRPVDLLFPSPVSKLIKREKAMEELLLRLITGYGVMTTAALSTLVGEPASRLLPTKLVKEGKVNKGYLAEEELLEVFYLKPPEGAHTGLSLVPPVDPSMVLKSGAPAGDWSIFDNGLEVGTLEPVFHPDHVWIKELTIFPAQFFTRDQEQKSVFISRLLKHFDDVFGSAVRGGVLVIERFNGRAASEISKEALEKSVLGGFRPYGGWLLKGDIWENRLAFGAYLNLILHRQRISNLISHPIEWIDTAGRASTEQELLLRMNSRNYPFDPSNPDSKRVGLHSLKELAKVNDLYKTYDLSGRPVFAKKEWAVLVGAAKGSRPTRNQTKVLQALPQSGSIEPSVLLQRLDITPERFKKDILSLKKMNLVLENGYGNLIRTPIPQGTEPADAWEKLVVLAFNNFVIFEFQNLYAFLGKLVPRAHLADTLSALEEKGVITKGFLLEDDDRLFWALSESIPKAGDVHTDRPFILGPRDPLAKYLAPWIKENFGRTSVFTYMRGGEFRGAFRGRLTRSNIIITEIIKADPQELKRQVERFSDLNMLKSFKSENAFKRYKQAKKIRKAVYEDYFYTEDELDDYLEEYSSYFGDLDSDDGYVQNLAEF